MSRLSSPSRRLLGVLVAAPFILAACTTSGEPADPTPEATAAPQESVTEEAPETAAESETEPEAEAEPEVEAEAETEPAAGTESEPEADTAAYLDIELTDAATGETFTLASLEGDVVAIEPMAIWCSNCKAQQNNVKEAYADIADAGVTYISLGIDPGENQDALAKYAERNGFEWTFAKSPTELSREFSDLFGQQILSAPSTPLIVLDANGDVFTQEWGFHGPDSLLGILDEAAGAA